MDKYVIKVDKKKSYFSGDQRVYDSVINAINTNQTLYLYGSSGIGKSYTVKKALSDITYIEISSNNRNLFIDVIDTHVVIDSCDIALPNTSKAIIIISRVKPSNKFENFEIIHMQTPTVNMMVNIGRSKFPFYPLLEMTKFAKRARGNIRDFLCSLDFSDEKDLFTSPKELIYNLACKDVKYPLKPSKYIGHSIPEHGYSCGIIHENYMDVIDSLDGLAIIADNISLSDIYDKHIYNGRWDLSPWFSLHGIVIPCIKINNSLSSCNMRPGSVWTKYNNYCMRTIKTQIIYNKTSLNYDTLTSLYTLCIHLGIKVIPILKYYGITKQFVDVMNHLAIKRKLNGRMLIQIKKGL